MGIFNHIKAEKNQDHHNGTTNGGSNGIDNGNGNNVVGVRGVHDPERYTLHKWPWRPRVTSFTSILQEVSTSDPSDMAD